MDAELASLIACPCMGFCVQNIGRKGSLLALTLPLSLGWNLIAFADGLQMLYSGRFLVGFVGGAYSVGVPIYINEMALESIRGRLGLINGVGIQIGICFPYVVGSFLPYNYLALSLCSVPVLIGVTMVWAVESPRYLLEKGKVEEALKALVWLRGTQDVQQELNLMQNTIDQNKEKEFHFQDFFTTRAILKPTVLCLSLQFFLVMSGIDAVNFYSFTIFNDSGTNIDPNICSITVGLIQVVSMILSAFAIDRLGRRPLLILSEITVVISLGVLGLYFYLSKYDESVRTTLGWMPLGSLVIFSIGYSFGIGPIPWIYLEILPTHVAGTATGIAVCFNWASAFLITRFFENVNKELGMEWSFWIFSILSGIGALFVYFCVPETKGKTLEEINEGFQ